MKHIFFKWLMLIQLLSIAGYAQSPVILTEGKILFERKVNAYSMINEMGEKGGLSKDKIDGYKSNNPAFKVSEFTLAFKDSSTLYQMVPVANAGPVSPDEWFAMVASDNMIYTDLNNNSATTEKHVFGNAFVVTDSVRKIQWKITSEIRNIAGFQCRRANAVIMDSIYVVAFYTNEIPAAGGPESFTGLPGMILGLALPYEHVTWFAKQVYSSSQNIPSNNKKGINYKQFEDKINEMTKAWGPVGPLIVRKAIL